VIYLALDRLGRQISSRAASEEAQSADAL
jgi:hypothetical protein